MKFMALFLVLFISIIINLPSGYLSILGLEPDLLVAVLAAGVIAGLSFRRRIFFMVLVVVMSLGANLPEHTMQHIGMNREILLAGLIAIVLMPYFLMAVGESE